jgi:hypothetical protein
VAGRLRLGWLWYCLGLVVVGCTSSASASPTPRVATFALLGWTFTPPTPTPLLRLLRTPTHKIKLTFMPTPLPILVSVPHCLETAVGSLWCLGQVTNTLSVPVQNVRVRIFVVNAAGVTLLETETACARMLLMPGEQAPYAALFTTAPEAMAGAIALLAGAADGSRSRHVPLSVSGVSPAAPLPQANPLLVRGQIGNPHLSPVAQITLIATLFNRDGAVIGFRQFSLLPDQALLAGQTHNFNVTVFAQYGTPHTVQVSAEGALP